jgi:cytoskeletal protein CcmA (bactofilin family)
MSGDATRSSARVARGVTVRGELDAPGDLAIEGRVEGALRVGHDLLIEADGSVDADVDADRVIIAGRAAGRVVARTSLELRTTARVEATLVSPSIAVADGAVLRGRLEMVVDVAEELP